MLTAEMARTKSDANAKETFERQLVEVEIYVNDAIREGLRRVTYNDNLSQVSCKELQRLGYGVLYNQKEDEYIISW